MHRDSIHAFILGSPVYLTADSNHALHYVTILTTPQHVPSMFILFIPFSKALLPFVCALKTHKANIELPSTRQVNRKWLKKSFPFTHKYTVRMCVTGCWCMCIHTVQYVYT